MFFGATVTYADAQGDEISVQIVGVDEADFEKGQISWVSPIARALMRAGVGDSVKVRTPAGPETIEIIAIAYDRVISPRSGSLSLCHPRESAKACTHLVRRNDS